VLRWWCSCSEEGRAAFRLYPRGKNNHLEQCASSVCPHLRALEMGLTSLAERSLGELALTRLEVRDGNLLPMHSPLGEAFCVPKEPEQDPCGAMGFATVTQAAVKTGARAPALRCTECSHKSCRHIRFLGQGDRASQQPQRKRVERKENADGEAAPVDSAPSTAPALSGRSRSLVPQRVEAHYIPSGTAEHPKVLKPPQGGSCGCGRNWLDAKTE
jgi:hypothetical protein